jgi:hypothetical protein
MFGKKSFVLAAVGLMLAGATVTSASAETVWQRHHPRRVEVNHRLANQYRRIREERREGEITRRQAIALHRDDHRIRNEERSMASLDNSHLTRADQRALNQQENAVSHDIPR